MVSDLVWFNYSGETIECLLPETRFWKPPTKEGKNVKCGKSNYVMNRYVHRMVPSMGFYYYESVQEREEKKRIRN